MIPTRYPERISQSLPPSWIGKGFQNVCIALVADGANGFSEQLQALRNAPVQHRAIFLFPSSLPTDFAGQLHGIDWVVFSGQPTAEMVKDAVIEIIGDNPRTAKPKQDPKQLLLDAFIRFRDAVLAKSPQQEIELRLLEL